ncbi:MAG: lipoprotein [Rhodoferax sp.]|nr:lipoprotein [Rhodoferax sp.]
MTRALVLAGCMVMVSGCGQTGDLYLPAKDTKASPMRATSAPVAPKAQP